MSTVYQRDLFLLCLQLSCWITWGDVRKLGIWIRCEHQSLLCQQQDTPRCHTDRFGGLQRSGGQSVPAATALGAEVRRWRRRVIDVRQDVVVPSLLLCSVCVVTVCGRGPGEVTICDGRNSNFKLVLLNFLEIFVICDVFNFCAAVPCNVL